MSGHRRGRGTPVTGIGEVIGRPVRLAVVAAVLLLVAVGCQPKAPNDGRDLYASLDPLPAGLEPGDYFALTGSFGDAGSAPEGSNLQVTLILSPNLRFVETPWQEGSQCYEGVAPTATVWRCAGWDMLGTDFPLNYAVVEAVDPGEAFALLVVRSATKEPSPDPTPNDAMVTTIVLDA